MAFEAFGVGYVIRVHRRDEDTAGFRDSLVELPNQADVLSASHRDAITPKARGSLPNPYRSPTGRNSRPAICGFVRLLGAVRRRPDG
jgi:hypothetical protein